MAAKEREPIDDKKAHEWLETTDLLTLIGHNSSVNGSCLLEQIYEDLQHHYHEFIAVIDNNQQVMGILPVHIFIRAGGPGGYNVREERRASFW